MIEFERLLTPREHMGVMAAPPPARMLALAEAPQACLGVRLLDTSFAQLRASLRERIGAVGPAIVTGHQAEFFHAGVFAKNVLADALARRLCGTAHFVTVDSDTPKSQKLIAPRLDVAPPQRVTVDIPGLAMNIAMEDQPALPSDAWAAMFREVRALADPQQRSLLPLFAEAWLAAAVPMDFTAGVMRGHAEMERALGLRCAHLRMSALCAAPEFRAFAAETLLRAEEFAETYNAAQRAYRLRRGVRNAARPAPPLARSDRMIEAPYWVSLPGRPRSRLFSRIDDGRLTLFADGASIAVEDVQAFRALARHAQPWELEQAGWRLRPRALTLSAFLRYGLSDLFVHGIGGAKYDEMTDDFASAFFGAAPPPIAAVSAALLLAPRSGRTSTADLSAARHALRDARYNPQRRLSGLPESLLQQRSAAVAQSVALARTSPRDRLARREAWASIRVLNQQMVLMGEASRAELEADVTLRERDVNDDRVRTDREYFYALHSRAALAALCDKLRALIE